MRGCRRGREAELVREAVEPHGRQQQQQQRERDFRRCATDCGEGWAGGDAQQAGENGDGAGAEGEAREGGGSGRRERQKRSHVVLEPAEFPEPMSRDPHVAILGGGMAGLMCALGLAERGIRSTVFDTVREGFAGGSVAVQEGSRAGSLGLAAVSGWQSRAGSSLGLAVSGWQQSRAEVLFSAAVHVLRWPCCCFPACDSFTASITQPHSTSLHLSPSHSISLHLTPPHSALNPTPPRTTRWLKEGALRVWEEGRIGTLQAGGAFSELPTPGGGGSNGGEEARRLISPRGMRAFCEHVIADKVRATQHSTAPHSTAQHSTASFPISTCNFQYWLLIADKVCVTDGMVSFQLSTLKSRDGRGNEVSLQRSVFPPHVTPSHHPLSTGRGGGGAASVWIGKMRPVQGKSNLSPCIHCISAPLSHPSPSLSTTLHTGEGGCGGSGAAGVDSGDEAPSDHPPPHSVFSPLSPPSITPPPPANQPPCLQVREGVVGVERPVWIGKMRARGGKWVVEETGRKAGEFDFVVIAHNGGWVDGWMVGWEGGWMGGWMDGRV
ncbi:unnamed protein product [Closterium sp. NIES-54]